MDVIDASLFDKLNELKEIELVIDLIRKNLKLKDFFDVLVINQSFNILLYENLDSKIDAATRIYDFINDNIFTIDVDAVRDLLEYTELNSYDVFSIIDSNNPILSFKFFINKYITICEKLGNSIVDLYLLSVETDSYVLKREKNSN